MPDGVARAASLTWAEKWVLGILWAHVGWTLARSGARPVMAWPSKKTIAEDMGLHDPKRVQRWLAKLADEGYQQRLLDLEPGQLVELLAGRVDSPDLSEFVCRCRKDEYRCTCRILVPIDPSTGAPMHDHRGQHPPQNAAPLKTYPPTKQPPLPPSKPTPNLSIESYSESSIESSTGSAPDPAAPAVDPTPIEPHPEAPRSPTPDHTPAGKLDRPIQDPLFELDPPAPKHRDPTAADRVVEYFNGRKRATAEWAGLSAPSGITITQSTRAAIEARIKDAGGGEAGILACKKVIEVQEAEARAHGQITATDPEGIKLARRLMKDQGGWKWWKVSTMFRPENFSRRLERWDSEGDHEVWGKPSMRPTAVTNPDDPGQNPEFKAKCLEAQNRGLAKLRRDGPPKPTGVINPGEIPF